MSQPVILAEGQPIVLPIVESLTITVVVDNATDALSPNPAGVKCVPDTMRAAMKSAGEMAKGKKFEAHDHPNVPEMSFSCMCDGAHGYSVLMKATTGEISNSVLFDGGPHERVFRTNSGLLDLDFASIEGVFLSHWHIDHSGGLPYAVQKVAEARKGNPPVVSLHSDFSKYRGVKLPPATPDGPARYWSMPANPSPSDLGALGGNILSINAPHFLASSFFCSPSIPRLTSYEIGIPNHVAYDTEKKEWMADPLLMDERYMVIKTPKGLVVTSGCSHAGIVNVVKDVKKRFPEEKIHWVQGGFHLADGTPEKIKETVKELWEAGVELVCPGHCTGWRALAELERVFGVDRVVHSVVGATFTI